jgi:P22_AR N-terminal domain
MRRIVENMGMAWNRQASKLLEQQDKFNCGHMLTVGLDGKTRKMVVMPVEKLPLWLTTINANKVDVAIRPKIERYQAESATALHDYWTKGAAFSQANVSVFVSFAQANCQFFASKLTSFVSIT